ncbi:MAG: hypothetical protein ABIQ04_00955 [Candidatus Saccharimonadales bacterium]
MDTSINLNTTVRVQLTEAGERVLLEYYDTLVEKHQEYQVPTSFEYSIARLLSYSLDNETLNTRKFQLWDLLQIFGPHTGYNQEQMFEGNVIFVFIPPTESPD